MLTLLTFGCPTDQQCSCVWFSLKI